MMPCAVVDHPTAYHMTTFSKCAAHWRKMATCSDNLIWSSLFLKPGFVKELLWVTVLAE